MNEPDWPERWENAETIWCVERCKDAGLTEQETHRAMTNPWKRMEPEIQDKIMEAWRNR